MELKNYSQSQLKTLETQLLERYQSFKKQGLKLDLTRGKPGADQLDLSQGLDGILEGQYVLSDGTDLRNYGGLDGLTEAKQLVAPLLGVRPEEVLIGGNSSLTLMYQVLSQAYFYGVRGKAPAWSLEKEPVKFLCPVPGYDRHFSICEELNITMIPVPLTEEGPDMAVIESMVKKDPSIKGIWCVPKYSNPTGHVYSDKVVDRIAALGKIAGPNFRVMWDNAYVIHDFVDNPPELANIMQCCRKHGTEDTVIITSSFSKVTFAGASIAFMGASEANLKEFLKRLTILTIGPDKVNQQRHVKFFKNTDGLREHMKKHAKLLKPKFDLVVKHLAEGLGELGIASWTNPLGGYFISCDLLPGLAQEVVKLAGEAGVKLTPAGATFPYKKDPADSNIRLSPSFPALSELDQTMQVFVTCVKLASVRKYLSQ
ncbi:aminotransferase class I/II-fold pyridoxal phosphate-dependent enzyme [Deltaproteobacteria bacterium TL4]